MNSQETHRGIVGPAVNEVVDERTQWEIYYPPFEASVQAGVGTFMCAYNKVNGEPACGSEALLQHDLKGRMGFNGWVMSDWLATHGIAVKEGLDQEMQWSPHYNRANMEKALLTGKITNEMLDDSVTRIFTPLIDVGAFDHPTARTPEKNVTRQAHSKLARELSAAATVLLKNDGGLLPISSKAKLVVLGAQAKDAIIGGSGSGFVKPASVSQPYEAICERVEGELVFADESDLHAAAVAAEAADIAVVFVGQNSGEGKDRSSLSLPREQEALILAVAKVQPRVVVVMVTPGPMLTSWRESVAAILAPGLPGQQYGQAITDVLFGDVNPSAKLTFTLPKIENEMEITQSQWPGVGGLAGFGLTATYTEKLEVGYRWYHAHSVEPAYAFGHGLSYTSFNYSSIHVDDKCVVTFDVENVGQKNGAEVAQLYLTFPVMAQEPPRQLKGFKKIALNQGQKKKLSLQLSPRDMSIWDVSAHDWREQQGVFGIEVGTSSADIRLTHKLHRAEVLV